RRPNATWSRRWPSSWSDRAGAAWAPGERWGGPTRAAGGRAGGARGGRAGGRGIRCREGGTVERSTEPGTGVFACMLGGDDGRTLFLCAAPDFHEEARKNAREGQLLASGVDGPHAGLPGGG